MPRARPKKQEEKKEELQLEQEETKPINRLLLKVSAYRTLAKLAADQEPIMKLNAYCEMVLTEHTRLSHTDQFGIYKKGKKG
jgi:hypothetical protein